jgi:hypothetical protein
MKFKAFKIHPISNYPNLQFLFCKPQIYGKQAYWKEYFTLSFQQFFICYIWRKLQVIERG